MERMDARKFNQQAQYTLRKRVVRLRKRGLTNRDVARIVGISEAHASTVWQKYVKGGIAAIHPGVRGRRQGAQRVLAMEQELAALHMLLRQTPQQLGLPFALWSRDVLRMAIQERFTLALPLRTMTDYLKRWGIVPQKPLPRADTDTPAEIKVWFAQDYPEIAARAKKEKAQVHWLEQTIVSGPSAVKGAHPRDKTARHIEPGTLKGDIRMISATTNQGKLRFMLHRATLTSRTWRTFLSALLTDTTHKVFLILDHDTMPQTAPITRWLEAHRGKIEVVFMPSQREKDTARQSE